jgi:hypothetical protein
MLPALYPWHVGLDHRNKAAGIQMSPFPATMIVRWTLKSALGARKAGERLVLKPHCHFGFFRSKIHLTDKPGGFYSE